MQHVLHALYNSVYVSNLGHLLGYWYHFACYTGCATFCCMSSKAKDHMLQYTSHATCVEMPVFDSNAHQIIKTHDTFGIGYKTQSMLYNFLHAVQLFAAHPAAESFQFLILWIITPAMCLHS